MTAGRTRRTRANLPSALSIPTRGVDPLDRRQVTWGHHHRAQWASSGGTSHSDGHRARSGYRSAGNLYLP